LSAVFFCAVPVFSSVKVNIDPMPAARNSRFSLQFVFDNFDGQYLKYEIVEEVDFFSVLGEPEIEMIAPSESEKGKMFVTFSCRAVESGVFILPEFVFYTSLGVLKSKPKVFEVGHYSRGRIVIPPIAEWQFNFEQLHRGESRPVYIVLKNLKEIPLVENISIYDAGNALLVETVNFGVIKKKIIDGIELFDVPVISYMVTSTSGKPVKLPSFRLKVDGSFINGDSLFIPCLELDSDLLKQGAIGNFSYDYKVSGKRVYTDGKISVEINISGEGNLKYLKVPEPVVEGLVFIDKHEDLDVVASKNGFTGRKSVVYSYVPESVQNAEITIPDFFWASPSENYEINQVEGKVFQIDIVSKEKGEIVAGSEKKLYQLADDNSLKSSGRYLFRQKWSFVLFLPGIFAFIAGVFIFIKKRFRRKTKNKNVVLMVFLLLCCVVPVFSDVSEDIVEPVVEVDSQQLYKGYIQSGRAFYENVDYEHAFSSFKSAYSLYPADPVASFNAALSAFQVGRKDAAVFFARKAAYNAPGVGLYMNFVQEIEAEYGLVYQISRPAEINPDIFFYIAVFLFNIVMFLGLFWVLKRNNWVVVINILFFLFAVASISGFAVTSNKASKLPEICSEDSVLYNIPENDSRVITDLPAGTAVNRIGQAGDYVLVETGYGQTGWIKSESFYR
jgi:tetratricopeptide (TPR) repeat protein